MSAAQKINFYYERRSRIDKWWSCGLKNLKYKLCECKRNRKSTANIMVQTDVRKHQDAGTQYELEYESSFTQTEESEDNARNSMVDPSDERVDSPEVNAAQNVPEPVDVDTASEAIDDQSEDVVAPEAEIHAKNAKTMTSTKGNDSTEAIDDVEMLNAAGANDNWESAPVATETVLLINDTNGRNTEDMFREVMHETDSRTNVSAHSVNTPAMEMELEMREAIRKSKYDLILSKIIL